MKCPETGETVFTCQRMKPTEFEALERELGFRCPACEQIHKWSKVDAWLEPAPISAALEAGDVLGP
jgi:hypothetical protein